MAKIIGMANIISNKMNVYNKKYDVIVVGAGHAGIEAALAAAKMGCQTLLLTTNLDTIGQMSCNPAIGGIGKGQLVKEIDALGGVMGQIADMSGLQFRILNRKKGPAVWSTRVQCDKKEYQRRAKQICENQFGLDIKQAHVIDILVSDQKAVGVNTSYNIQFYSEVLIITVGTFLRGLLHYGNEKRPGGRSGESPSNSLSESFKKIGFKLGRFKTGTPPRISKKTVNFDEMTPQNGEEPVPFFSFWKDDLFHVEQKHIVNENHVVQKFPFKSVLYNNCGQLPCYITHTTLETRQIILENLDKSPLYSGKITGIGPRYCPSIEDKFVRFHQKPAHQIFLEPEGTETDELYVNGFSTSMPVWLQCKMVRSILGCENAEIIRPGYAVEYDFVYPSQIGNTLETKLLGNLFLAGQICGTSGYEEAAAQGIVAGINAALKIKGKKPFILDRNQSFIGVLVDDLVTKEIVEPYRMFTSRAEFRLFLREDNADLRLSHIGYNLGLLSYKNYSKFLAKKQIIDEEINRLHLSRHGSETLAQILSRPNVRYNELPGSQSNLNEEIVNEIEIIIKYNGYVNRQKEEAFRIKSLEEKGIPEGFKFEDVSGLRMESKLKLSKIRPKTVGQAMRVGGVTPADINLILVWLKRWECRHE